MAHKSKKLPRTYGWRPDHPDHRDHKFALKLEPALKLPPRFTLQPSCPPIYDQGSLGSCTGNAIAFCHQFDQLAQKAPAPFAPSRLFIYYNERALEGTVKQDAGAAIRDGIKTIAKQGACSERVWPYNVSAFATRPTKAAYDEGAKHTAVSYSRIDPSRVDNLKACLFGAKRPFAFGFSVYQSFESDEVAKTGVVPMPTPDDQLLGGHAVGGVGWDDEFRSPGAKSPGVFIVRNSWGPKWGVAGHFVLPYEYVTSPNLADDFWNLQIVK